MKRPKSEQKVKVIALHLTKKEHKEFGARAKDAGYKSLTSYAASLCGLAVARPPRPPKGHAYSPFGGYDPVKPEGQEAAPEPQFDAENPPPLTVDRQEFLRQ